MTAVRPFFLRRLTSSLLEVADLFLPPACQLCGAPASQSMERVLCEDCACSWQEVPAGCDRCGREVDGAEPPAPVPLAEGRLCSHCRTTPPRYTRARSLYIYEGHVSEAIRALKYQHRFGLASLLGHRMASSLRALFSDEGYRSLVPVPMHWTRRIKRGYNQAELLAEAVGEQAKIPVSCLLERTRKTLQQARLGYEERQSNLEGAFGLKRGASRHLQGSHILLIDDVFTTGATSSLCADVLLNAGARRVDVFTLARAM